MKPQPNKRTYIHVYRENPTRHIYFHRDDISLNKHHPITANTKRFPIVDHCLHTLHTPITFKHKTHQAYKTYPLFPNPHPLSFTHFLSLSL